MRDTIVDRCTRSVYLIGLKHVHVKFCSTNMAKKDEKYRLSNQHVTIWDPVEYAHALCTMETPDTVYTNIQKRIVTHIDNLFKQGE